MVQNKSVFCKAVITRNITEIYTYEHLNIGKGGNDVREGEGVNHDDNYKKRQRQRRNAIRQLACANFDRNDKFVTLTFRDGLPYDIRNVQECNKAFKQFIQRLKRRYEGLKYIAVIEFQDKNDRGAVHYHMLCNLPFVKKPLLAEIWGQGFVKINAIDKVDNVGAYVVKYMITDIDDERLCGIKAYLHSRNLVKPDILCSWKREDEGRLSQLLQALDKQSPVYGGTYTSEKAGEISYNQYNKDSTYYRELQSAI